MELRLFTKPSILMIFKKSPERWFRLWGRPAEAHEWASAARPYKTRPIKPKGVGAIHESPLLASMTMLRPETLNETIMILVIETYGVVLYSFLSEK
jgi:hypothetical protein